MAVGRKRMLAMVGAVILLVGCGPDEDGLDKVIIGTWTSPTTDYLEFRARGNGKAAFQGDMLEYTLKWKIGKGEPVPLTLDLSSGLRGFGSIEGTIQLTEGRLILAGFDHDKINGVFQREVDK